MTDNDSTYEFNPTATEVESFADIPSENLLDRLRDEVKRKIQRPEVLITVPERPGIKVKISPNITQEQMKAWRKNSGENSRNGLDPIKFACYVVGGTTRGIVIDEQEVFGETGAPLSFASPEILAMTETSRPVPDCIRAFFGLDPHVEAAAMAILQAAGYDDEIEASDPTKTSSTS